MSNTESCCGGANCDYSKKHELPLVEKIMHTIEQYNKDKRKEPCPACLRDAMLAVAALFHLRAAGPAAVAYAGDIAAESEFADKACERLRLVTETVAGGFTGLKQ